LLDVLPNLVFRHIHISDFCCHANGQSLKETRIPQWL
jgi:hypothetical protein